MRLPVILRPEAQNEFDEAVDWYEEQASRGADFIARVQETLDRIAANPQLHQTIHEDVRRAIVPRFPYVVLYRIAADHVRVIAIFHTRRDPSTWQARS